VLEDGDLVLYESAAICLHLCDRFPQAGWHRRVGTPARAHFYKWLVWLTNTLQATLIHYFYPGRLVDEGNAEGARQVKAHAEARIGTLLQQLDDQLAAHGGPWLLGADYSALDQLRLDAVPLDTRLREPAGARLPAAGALVPAAHAGAAGGAAHDRRRSSCSRRWSSRAYSVPLMRSCSSRSASAWRISATRWRSAARRRLVGAGVGLGLQRGDALHQLHLGRHDAGVLEDLHAHAQFGRRLVVAVAQASGLP
jgi:glutathione S-transferase